MRREPKKQLQIAVLTIWASGSIVTGSVLHSLHQPFAEPAASIANLDTHARSGWRALHILSPACGCSQTVARHLAARGPIPTLSEQVILAGAGTLQADLSRFPLRHRLPRDLEQYDVHGVPLLVLISPDGRVAYAGGYGPRNHQDMAIFARLQAGESVPSFPIRGCALSRRVQRRLDPLFLKHKDIP